MSPGQGQFGNLFLVMKLTAQKQVQIVTLYLSVTLCDRDLVVFEDIFCPLCSCLQMFSDHITS